MVRKVLLVALGVLVIFAGLPLIGGMTMVDCPDCVLSSSIAGACFAVLASLLMLVSLASMRLVTGHRIVRYLLLRSRLERPPRAA